MQIWAMGEQLKHKELNRFARGRVKSWELQRREKNGSRRGKKVKVRSGCLGEKA